jgi:hypothetical protein
VLIYLDSYTILTHYTLQASSAGRSIDSLVVQSRGAYDAAVSAGEWAPSECR